PVHRRRMPADRHRRGADSCARDRRPPAAGLSGAGVHRAGSRLSRLHRTRMWRAIAMTAGVVFFWAALSLLLIALAVEPREAEAWAALASSIVLLVFLGRHWPR